MLISVEKEILLLNKISWICWFDFWFYFLLLSIIFYSKLVPNNTLKPVADEECDNGFWNLTVADEECGDSFDKFYNFDKFYSFNKFSKNFVALINFIWEDNF